jgi:hypothetical protein
MADDQLAEILAEKLALDTQIDELRERKRALAQRENDILVAEDLKRKLGTLDDNQLAVLQQQIAARGVPSGEVFGTPGA